MLVRIVDAFTDRPFSGNPAGVVVLDAEDARVGDAAWMQDVAAELNLSETAFAVRTAVPATFDLRWFTPTTEVDLCGHATLATAHALTEDGEAAPFVFRTRSGELRADVDDRGVVLDFPAQPVREPDGAEDLRHALAAALGCEVVAVQCGGADLVVEVPDADAVRSLRPDQRALAAVEARGVVVTAAGDGPGADVVSRFFAPRVGVPEDPVTGSAHCALAPFWVPRLGRSAFRARQVSARGGELTVELAGDRVRLTGRAVTVLRGELRAGS